MTSKISMRAPFVVHGKYQSFAARRYPFLSVTLNSTHQNAADLGLLEGLLRRGSVDLVAVASGDDAFVKDLSSLLQKYRSEDEPNSLLVDDSIKTSGARFGATVCSNATKMFNLNLPESAALAFRFRQLGDPLDEQAEAVQRVDLFMLPFSTSEECKSSLSRVETHVGNKPVLVEFRDAPPLEAQLREVIRHNGAGISLDTIEILKNRARSPGDIAAALKNSMFEECQRRKQTPEKFLKGGLPDKWAKLLKSKGTPEKDKPAPGAKKESNEFANVQFFCR